MHDWVPLVTDWAPDGTEVSVCRDSAGDLWLATSVDGTMQGGAQIPTWTGGDGWGASGGPLPEGAEEAVARHPDGTSAGAVVAGGCWLAIVGGGGRDVPVRFHDRFGRLVPAPPRGELVGPVADATEPCAACDGTEWEERRGSEHLVRCRTCGHDVGVPTFYAPLTPGEEPTPEQEAAWAAEAERDMLVHGEVRVTTTFDDLPEASADVARRELADLLGQDAAEWPDLSEPALAVWLDARGRVAAEAGARAPLAPASIAVDGEPVEFLRAGDDEAWAAVATARPVDGRTLRLAVAARGAAPALERVGTYGGATWRPEFGQTGSAS